MNVLISNVLILIWREKIFRTTTKVNYWLQESFMWNNCWCVDQTNINSWASLHKLVFCKKTIKNLNFKDLLFALELLSVIIILQWWLESLCPFFCVQSYMNLSDLPSGWCLLQPEKHGSGSGPPPGGLWRDGGAWRDEEGPQLLPARHWPVVSCRSVVLNFFTGLNSICQSSRELPIYFEYRKEAVSGSFTASFPCSAKEMSHFGNMSQSGLFTPS